jgi:putative transposase
MEYHRRDSLRLKGYDYSEPGEYFITICTADRRQIFGEIDGGRLRLSVLGKIVDECWRKIPEHFAHTSLPAFQIMPNHMHGIIHIGPCRGVQLNAPTENLVAGPTGDMFSAISPGKGTLGVIVRTFKAAVMSEARRGGRYLGHSLWQRSFYDRIIRDDREHFLVEQYITLNPLFWHLDRNNPGACDRTADELRKELRQEYRLDEYTVEGMLEHLMAQAV